MYVCIYYGKIIGICVTSHKLQEKCRANSNTKWQVIINSLYSLVLLCKANKCPLTPELQRAQLNQHSHLEHLRHLWQPECMDNVTSHEHLTEWLHMGTSDFPLVSESTWNSCRIIIWYVARPQRLRETAKFHVLPVVIPYHKATTNRILDSFNNSDSKCENDLWVHQLLSLCCNSNYL